MKIKEVEKIDSQYVEAMRRFLSIYRYLRQYGRKMQSENLSGREVSILRYLMESEPLTIGQCRDYLFLSDSSTSELMAHMEQNGQVIRARSQSDNRSVMVTLTAAGRKLARSLTLGGMPLLREKLKTLSPDQLSRLYDALGDIEQLLEIAE